MEISGKISDLIDEIAAASGEQAQGIEQVSLAVADMEKVIQQNAANAEESASASSQLSSQAEQMKGIVSELVGLVGGDRGRRSRSQSTEKGPGQPGRPLPRAAALAGSVTHPPAKEVTPERVIPLNDKDFEDF